MVVPAVRDHEGSQLQHLFRVVLQPEDTVSLEPHVDHSADAAFDCTAAQGETQFAEVRVVQPTSLAMPTKIVQFRLQCRVLRFVIGESLKLADHVFPLAVAKPGSQVAVQRHAFFGRNS